MRMLRTTRLDASDERVFPRAAVADEWAVPGGFVFTLVDTDPAEISGAARQAFARGFLGLSSFGRATLVTVAECQPADYDAAIAALAGHLRDCYGAPNDVEARRVAAAEIDYAVSLCEQPVNTLLSVQRELTNDGIEEHFAVHDSRPLWQRDTRIFKAVPDDGAP